ncbi:hypothetical protein LTR99_007516 [Exophiala xenobiotica]|uniref:INO80 complex, subunit Ies4 n=1 Tax=Vermiconidia calcicola TaxID=1690605 RepID=A0AAV9Q5W3_9PEZI|nr:hypothetical protein H2202_001575 [Exophiala xenobiotica]KAK5529896.1 hypothetical protein LTR23_010540 [Chaetothyriales sp. CCFEE 6169]KAK5534625.1 hypothetical protein LTR25_006657 [Vermiconidia calcicola]KAK5198235.1 hypothetical protein LTR92_002480 [Exophiala xenobiotica]KAK5228213.1 hypothetical protein LTR72_002096 [Exophiala xenobiotica]
MAVSSSSTPGRSPSARPDKSKKQTKTVILKLSPKLLRRFEEPAPKTEDQSTNSSASSPAPAADDLPTLKVPDANDNASESNSTPAPNGDTSSGDASKKRKNPSAGSKRSLGQMAAESNGTPKPRGKPGPKKKPRLDDGTIDHAGSRPSLPAMPGAHRLGPKANQGAINAGLRALDRSGKPCRKWIKKAFTVKSFTGVVWEVPSWKGNERLAMLNGDGSSDAKDISQQSSSDIKPNESDTAMDSNVGEHLDPMVMSTPAPSSPVPMPPPPAAIAAQG